VLHSRSLECIAACCSALQCATLCCSAATRACCSACCSALQCAALCCSMLQFVASCCSDTHLRAFSKLLCVQIHFNIWHTHTQTHTHTHTHTHTNTHVHTHKVYSGRHYSYVDMCVYVCTLTNVARFTTALQRVVAVQCVAHYSYVYMHIDHTFAPICVYTHEYTHTAPICIYT